VDRPADGSAALERATSLPRGRRQTEAWPEMIAPCAAPIARQSAQLKRPRARRSLIARLIADLCKSGFDESLQEFERVRAKRRGGHLRVPIAERLEEGIERLEVRWQELPNHCTHRVQTEIDFALRGQEDSAFVEALEHHIGVFRGEALHVLVWRWVYAALESIVLY